MGTGMAASELKDHKYVSITSFRRNGEGVATPVWFVTDGEDVFIWTVSTSGKVKRMRRNPIVRLAPCKFDGRLMGPCFERRASVLRDDSDRALDSAFRSKYGLLYRADRVLSKLSGKKRVFVKISQASAEP